MLNRKGQGEGREGQVLCALMQQFAFLIWIMPQVLILLVSLTNCYLHGGWLSPNEHKKVLLDLLGQYLLGQHPFSTSGKPTCSRERHDSFLSFLSCSGFQRHLSAELGKR